MTTQPCGHPESASNDRLREAAQQAGLDIYAQRLSVRNDLDWYIDSILRHITPVFEQAVRDERERCAKIAESIYAESEGTHVGFGNWAAKEILELIRKEQQ